MKEFKFERFVYIQINILLFRENKHFNIEVLINSFRMAKLSRQLPLIAVIAAALSSVIGGGINVLLVEIQNELKGIGSLVPLAILCGGLIALVIALLYASLSTAMPRAGGGYIYISRGLSPFLGFIAAFLKWSGSVIALGTIAYMDTIIASTMAHYANFTRLENFLSTPQGTILFSLLIIWIFWVVNYFGVISFARTVVALATIMFAGGALIIYVGLSHSQADFLNSLQATFQSQPAIQSIQQASSFMLFFQAIAILFWAYIGFTSISQAGGEIKNPKKNLPKAFIFSSLIVMLYYLLYSFSFYHAVPWQYIVGKSGLNVPELIGHLLPQSFALFITVFVFIALANDIPPMLYTKSRLFYSWAKDNIIPKFFVKTNKYKVPIHSLTAVAVVASLVAIESALGGFFTEINVVVMSRFIVYIMMAASLIIIKSKNPEIFNKISFMKNRFAQIIVSILTIIFSSLLLLSLVYFDFTSGKSLLNMATIQSLAIMLFGALIYFSYVKKMTKLGKDYKTIFERLPSE